MKFIQKQFNHREYFIDFLKTLAIIFIIIDNSAICWAEECSFPPLNVKLLYGECFWVGQGVPIFLFISGWLFVKWFNKNQLTSIKQCYLPKTIITKYLRFVLPIAIAIMVKVILLGFINGWGINILTRLGGGPGWYYVYIVLQLIIVCPILFILIKRFGFKALIGIFIFSTGFDLICWGANWDVDVYKCFIPRFCFIISTGMYVCMSIQTNKKYKLYFAIPMFIIGLALLICTYYFNLPMHVNHRWFQDCTLANLYIIPVLSLLVRLFKMKNQKWWSIIGKATFNIFLCQNILLTFPKQIDIAKYFILQVLLNELIAISCGLLFWFVEHKLTFVICNKIKNYHRNRNL